MSDYFVVQNVINERIEKVQKVKGKETPFRCVFKSRYGHSYTYHETLEDAEKETDMSCGYDIYGRGWTHNNKKLRIEKQGPRGGWSKTK